MTRTTSQTHSETIAGWSPIGPLVSGMGSSLAFTVLTGLAEHPAFPLPSAFRTCYGPRCLSAQGQSRDLRHFSPMPTRGGYSVLRDMAHMGISPIDSNIPHACAFLSVHHSWGNRVLLSWCVDRNDPLITAVPRKTARGSTIFPYRSNRVEEIGFPPAGVLSRFNPAPALHREGLEKS